MDLKINVKKVISQVIPTFASFGFYRRDIKAASIFGHYIKHLHLSYLIDLKTVRHSPI